MTDSEQREAARQFINIAVMKAYGFSTKMNESDCVGELMRMYQELVEKAR